MTNLGSKISGQPDEASQKKYVKIRAVCEKLPRPVTEKVCDDVYYGWTVPAEAVYDFVRDALFVPSPIDEQT